MVAVEFVEAARFFWAGSFLFFGFALEHVFAQR